jgi:hypothetical protein
MSVMQNISFVQKTNHARQSMLMPGGRFPTTTGCLSLNGFKWLFRLLADASDTKLW